MIIGFIGGSQKILPKTNFARFLLMMFLMNSLVIRTLYQGSFYQIMQSNNQQKEAQSINEMLEKDYKILVINAVKDMLQGSDMMKTRFGS